jgi:hypothetical protein
MAHLVDPEKKMAAVLFGMASAMPWMLQSFDDDSRYATFESGGSSAVGFARLGGHHVPTSHRHRRLTREWAALPRPGKEGLRGGGNDRGGELCAIVGDGGRSGWRLG